MILLINTSSSTCKISLVKDSWRYDDEWDSGRELAKGLLSYLQEKLSQNNKSWKDISAIGVFEGPGSFTGLRIGLTVANTMADSLGVAIAGGRGNYWQDQVVSKIESGANEKIVLPFYDREVNITTPRK